LQEELDNIAVSPPFYSICICIVEITGKRYRNLDPKHRICNIIC